MNISQAKAYCSLKRLCIAWLVVFMIPFMLVNLVSLFLEHSFPRCMELHMACAVTVPQLELVETAIYNTSIYGIIAITVLLSFKVSSYIMNKVKAW
ncbi:MAG: hypothetical protein OSB62_03360 [Alphaproteobacteria bacterium]|nr:hypothetical protein [Alphaproteobacteria bacterium]